MWDFPLDQPGGGQVEQQARTLITHPRPQLEPSDKTKILGLCMEILIAIAALNLAGMVAMGRSALQIVRQAGWIDPELTADVGDDTCRDFRRVAQKRAQKAHGAQLEPMLGYTQFFLQI